MGCRRWARVAPDLVETPCLGEREHQRAVLGAPQRHEGRRRVHPSFALVLRDRVVDADEVWHLAAGDGEVSLLGAPLGEAARRPRRRAVVEREGERAARAAIEAMNGPDPGSELIAHAAHDDVALSGPRARVHDETGGLVDNDDRLVSEEDGDGRAIHVW
jgi:hypothetical protein